MHEVCMSSDKRYRYWLEANVSDDNGRVCMFLMLNPSTADAMKSDPTISTCKRFARDWGYGTVRVCNLFALRSPYPKVLKDSGDPVGPENDKWVMKSARRADVIVGTARGETMGFSGTGPDESEGCWKVRGTHASCVTLV